MTAWTHTRQTLCSRGQHHSLQEQTGPFKPKPETAFLPRYSSHGIEQVLQELDFKSIQPHNQEKNNLKKYTTSHLSVVQQVALLQ